MPKPNDAAPLKKDIRKKIEWNAKNKGPLKNIKVLDISRLVAGNMLTLQLADLGADVIKIESAEKGDPLRDWKEEGIALFWKYLARNKRSLALNLREKSGLELFKNMLKTTNVLVENFRPGILEKMGLDEATINSE